MRLFRRARARPQVRNHTPGLRAWYSQPLHELGKTTLETYLMQHHLWLSSNAKSLLTIVQGFPKVQPARAAFFFSTGFLVGDTHTFVVTTESHNSVGSR